MFELCQLNRLNALLGVIFMILVIGSIQYASADHSLGGQGIFKNENDVNLASTIDSKWLIHLQVVVRDAQDQLVSVTEVAHGSYIPHQVSDYIFDEYLGEKEIINIGKVSYEKAELIETKNVKEVPFRTSFEDMQSFWGIEYCIKTKEHGNEQGISCITVFQAITPSVTLGENDTYTQHWTILRDI